MSDHAYNLDAEWFSSNAQFEAAKGKMIFFFIAELQPVWLRSTGGQLERSQFQGCCLRVDAESTPYVTDHPIAETRDMKVVMTGHHFGNNPLATLVNTKLCKRILKKSLKPWYMGARLKGLSKSFQMNTNMTELSWFSINFASLCLGRKVASTLEVLKL